MSEEKEKPKECKVVNFQDYLKKLRAKEEQELLKKILQRGNPLDKK